MRRLLASSPTLNGIKELIADCLLTDSSRILIDGKRIIKDGKVKPDIQVFRKNGRYRLEFTPPQTNAIARKNRDEKFNR